MAGRTVPWVTATSLAPRQADRRLTVTCVNRRRATTQQSNTAVQHRNRTLSHTTPAVTTIPLCDYAFRSKKSTLSKNLQFEVKITEQLPFAFAQPKSQRRVAFPLPTNRLTCMRAQDWQRNLEHNYLLRRWSSCPQQLSDALAAAHIHRHVSQ